jgi:hypothetical protein
LFSSFIGTISVSPGFFLSSSKGMSLFFGKKKKKKINEKSISNKKLLKENQFFFSILKIYLLSHINTPFVVYHINF